MPEIRSCVRRLAGLVVVAAAICGPSACSSGDPARNGAVDITADAQTLQLLREPEPVGAFSVTDLDGKVVTSEALRGKVVLVNFWATWCPPCRAEIPDLIELQNRYKDSLVVLGISEDEAPPDTVRAFAAQFKVNYFVGMTTPELSKVFSGVSALPTTFVIDRDGLIVQKHVGQLNPQTTELEAQYLTGANTNVRIERVDDPKQALLANAAQAKEIPGLDLTALTPEQRTAAIKALNADNCTCGCGLTLAACRINDPQCGVSLPLARELVDKLTHAH